MISLLPSVAPLTPSLAEGSGPAYTHWDASWWSSSVLSRAPPLLPPLTKYVWVKQLQSQYNDNAQLTTYHLVIVVVIATTVVPSRCLQAGQQCGLPLGVVPHYSGDAIIRAPEASCDDDLATAGHIDTTSISAMKYQLVSILY